MSRRASIDYLAGLSRRVSIEQDAGIDLRKTWTREAERAPAFARPQLEQIRAAIAGGETLTSAINRTGEFFPPLFRKMVEVGEQTGQAPEVFRQLASHYEERITLRREFRAAISWPMFQLGIAIFIVGVLIWVMGLIRDSTGSTADPLGFGLVGNRGLLIYLTFLACVAGAAMLLWRAVKSGALWVAPVERFVMMIPYLGKALETLALSRFAWSLQLTLGAGMEVRRSLALSLESTRNLRYASLQEQVRSMLTAGREIHETLAATGAFPPEFVDAVEVGERSGRLAESMAGLSRSYQEKARAAIAMLTKVAGFAVWAMVAILIITLIFRLAAFYTSSLSGAM